MSVPMSFDQLCHDLRVSDRERLLLLVHLHHFRHESALRKLWLYDQEND